MNDGMRTLLDILQRHPNWSARVAFVNELDLEIALSGTDERGKWERRERLAIPDLDNCDFDLLAARLTRIEREIIEWLNQPAAEQTAGE